MDDALGADRGRIPVDEDGQRPVQAVRLLVEDELPDPAVRGGSGAAAGIGQVEDVRVVPIVGDVFDPDEIEDAVRLRPGLERRLVTLGRGLRNLDECTGHRRGAGNVVVIVRRGTVRLERIQLPLVVPDGVGVRSHVDVELRVGWIADERVIAREQRQL